MASVATTISPHRRRKRGLPENTAAILLVFCCFLTLGITILHGSMLNALASQNSNHIDALVSNLHQGRGPLPSDLRVASLSCAQFGGPSPEIAQEMVYWQDIASDNKYKSPFLEPNVTRYMTFEPDTGGFNNLRMALETVLAIAHASGRTLVLPPEQEVYLLYRDKKGQQRKDFSFNDFFPMQEAMHIITMDEFLRREGITGRLKDRSGRVTFPPSNRTNWDGMTSEVATELEPWQQNIAYMPDWNPATCLAAFPTSRGPQAVQALQQIWDGIQNSGGFPSYHKYVGRPVPVHASATERLKENAKERERLCIYDEAMQQEPLIHFHGKEELGGRLLVHFYAFLFFDDWRQDLLTKRFVRDHVRYVDNIQCAAARVVQAIRERARERDPSNVEGHFDAFHIRRGEFQYKKTRLSASEIYEVSKDKIPEGATVFIATDERRRAFFADMASHYDLVFLGDYKHLIEDLNSNFYGMVDQLVASRSRVFFGCWFSTFTSYINRIRGYHSDRLKLPGFATGVIESYYYALPENKLKMKEYWPVSGVFYAREFPVSWRNIDQGIEELGT